MLKTIYYCETNAYDLIISADEDGTIRWTDDALLDEIDRGLPAWLNIFNLDRPTRAKIVFSLLMNGGSDDNWTCTEDSEYTAGMTLEQLLDGVEIIDETVIDM